MTTFQTKLSYTTSKVKSDANEGSKFNPLFTGKSDNSKPVGNVPCDNNSSGHSDGEKGGLFGGGTPGKGGDHKEILGGIFGGSNPTHNTPKSDDHNGSLGGSNPHNTPKDDDHNGSIGGILGGIFGGSNHSDNNPKGDDHNGSIGGSNPVHNTPKDDDHHSSIGGILGGIFGGSNHSDNNPKGDDHNGSLGGSNPGNVPSQPVDLIIQGTACNDTLRGNSSGRDTLVGTTAVARGVGERDVLIGGNASDTFVLGDNHGSFYVGNGNADYAEIQSFNRCNEGLQLAGSEQDYTVSYANGISSIYSNVGGASDLIATVNSGCSAIDLTAKYCHFVAPACGVVY